MRCRHGKKTSQCMLELLLWPFLEGGSEVTTWSHDHPNTNHISLPRIKSEEESIVFQFGSSVSKIPNSQKEIPRNIATPPASK